MRKQTPNQLVIDITANNYNRKTSEKENSYNNNHLWIISAFPTLDLALDPACPSRSLALWPIQSEEEIKQLSIPPSKEKEEEEIWPPKESVSGNSFFTDEVLSIFLPFFFFLCLYFLPRWQNNYTVVLWSGIPIILAWILRTSRQILGWWREGH